MPAPEPRQDDEQLATKLQASEQERERLEKQLQEARSADKMGVPTIEQRSPETSQEMAQLREQVKRLIAERDALREEKRQGLQDQRRKRIEEWRSAIRNFDFETERFGATDTYSQMRPHLQPKVIRMFETAGITYADTGMRGDSIHGRTLLDEVARIEKEWGLV